MNGSFLRREWTACGAIARSCVRQRAHMPGSRLTFILLALAVTLGAGAGLLSSQWGKALGLGAGMPLALLAWLWWSYLVDSVIAQNRAGGAALVPHMKGRSLALMLFAWAVLTVSVGLLLSLAWPQAWFLCAMAGVILALTAWFKMSYWSMLFCSVLLLPSFFRRRGMPINMVERMSIEQAAAVAAVVSVVCALLVDRYLGKSTWPAFTAKQPGAALYAYFLRGDCRRRTGGLLMHVLGPAADAKLHFTNVALSAAFLSLLAAFGILMRLPAGFAAGMLVTLTIAAQLMTALGMVKAMHATRHEQALVRLVPAAPRAVRFNATLSGLLLRHIGGLWILSAFGLLAVLYSVGTPPQAMLRVLAALCMTLMTAGAVLRDYARAPAYGFAWKAGAGIWIGATMLVTVTALNDNLAPLWWIALACAALACALAYALRQRHVMLGCAVAFPASRA